SRIGRRLGAVRIVGVELIVLRVHTGRRRIKNSLAIASVGCVQDVEVDARRIMHHVGIVLAGEDVASTPHVGCELVNFVEAAVNHLANEIGVAKVADQKVISLGLAETWKFEVGPSNPEAFALESPYKMMTDEATGPTNQCSFSVHWLRGHFTISRLF